MGTAGNLFVAVTGLDLGYTAYATTSRLPYVRLACTTQYVGYEADQCCAMHVLLHSSSADIT